MPDDSGLNLNQRLAVIIGELLGVPPQQVENLVIVHQSQDHGVAVLNYTDEPLLAIAMMGAAIQAMAADPVPDEVRFLDV